MYEKTHRMNRAESFRVVNWIHSKGQDLSKMTRKEALKAVEKDLGFKISWAALENIFKATGIPVPFIRTAVDTDKRRHYLRALAKACLWLNAAVKEISRHSGVPEVTHAEIMGMLNHINYEMLQDIANYRTS